MTTRQNLTHNLIGGVLCLLVCVTVGLTLRAALASGNMPPEENTDSRSPLRVKVARSIRVNKISLNRDFTGVVKPARESQLSFERNGRVVSMLVDEGDVVVQGQLLGTIDVEAVAAQLEVAQAGMLQAEAVLAELVAGPRPETIASTRAKVESLAANAKRLESDFNRSSELIANSAISQERYDATKFQLAAAVAEQVATQRQLDELLAGTRIEQLNAQKAIVQQLKAQVRTLRLDLEDGNLHAPFAGRIAERLVDEGTVASAGTTAFRIVEDSQLEAWIGITRATARQLKLGQSYDVLVSGRKITGKLVSLRPQLDSQTRTQNAILQLDRKDAENIVPGEIARFATDQQIDVSGFVLPTTALTPGPRGLWNVIVVNETAQPHVAEHRSVELLYSLGDSSLVDGTLRNGEAIVIDGVHRIVAGQSVEFAETKHEVAP